MIPTRRLFYVEVKTQSETARDKNGVHDTATNERMLTNIRSKHETRIPIESAADPGPVR